MDEITATADELIAPPTKSSLQWLKPALGYVLAIGGLVWVLHDFQLSQLRELVSHLDWRWIALAVACDVASYVCQGFRWRLLLKPQGELSTLRATQAIYAGLFTNEILPMRLGELVRAWLVSRWTAVRFAAIIPSMVAERLFDALWLAIGVGLTALAVPLPKNLLYAADVLGIVVVLGTAAILYFALRPPTSNERSSGLWHFVSNLLETLSGHLRAMGRTREFSLSLAGSLFLLVFQALAFWLVMRGCGLQLNVWAGIAVLLIVRLGTAIPNAPANVGSYQFFTVVGLSLFGVDKTVATGFSLVVFVLLTAPLFVLGFLAMSASGTSLLKIRQEVQTLAD